MADSAPAATSTARAIRLIPLSAPHGVGFTTLVFISMSAIPLKSANSSLTFLSQRLWNTQIKKGLFSLRDAFGDLGHSWLAAVSLLRPPIAYDAAASARACTDKPTVPLLAAIPDQELLGRGMSRSQSLHGERAPFR